jgi:hypothetical protein
VKEKKYHSEIMHILERDCVLDLQPIFVRKSYTEEILVSSARLIQSQRNNRRNKYGHDKEEVDVTANKRVDKAGGGDQTCSRRSHRVRIPRFCFYDAYS